MAAIAPAHESAPATALIERGRAQDGFFTTADVRDAGVSERALRRLLDLGVVERVHRGLYHFAAVPWTWEARQRGACLLAGPDALASHAGAARLLGIPGVRCGRPEITVASKTLVVPDTRIHRTRSLPVCDRTDVRGIPCTTGSRTLIDLAARLEVPGLIAAVDAAICAGVAQRGVLHERALALRRGRRGVGPLVAVTAADADGVFWSTMERVFGGHVRSWPIPLPLFNARLEHDGRTYFADALWPQHRLIAELQGLRFHRTPAQRGRDDERRNAFAELDHRVLVFGWEQVHGDPPVVLATLRAALG
jgi:hypothetical protein